MAVAGVDGVDDINEVDLHFVEVGVEVVAAVAAVVAAADIVVAAVVVVVHDRDK